MDNAAPQSSSVRLIPTFLFTGFLVLLNAAVFFFLDWLLERGVYSWQNIINTMLVGAIFGQGCYAALLGGLIGRSWLDGFLLAVGLSVTSFTFTIITFHWFTDESLEDAHIVLTLFPAMVLAAITPLLACRQLLGWRPDNARTTDATT